jgi:hypothetical protein
MFNDRKSPHDFFKRDRYPVSSRNKQAATSEKLPVSDRIGLVDTLAAGTVVTAATVITAAYLGKILAREAASLAKSGGRRASDVAQTAFKSLRRSKTE